MFFLFIEIKSHFYSLKLCPAIYCSDFIPCFSFSSQQIDADNDEDNNGADYCRNEREHFRYLQFFLNLSWCWWLKGSKNGFGAGEFVPYLSIAYRARRQDGGEAAQGRLHPLVTRDGMRYGNNVRLPGPGAYTITLTIDPPVKVGFGRHTDLETGVARWWSTMQVEWTLKHSAPSGSR